MVLEVTDQGKHYVYISKFMYFTIKWSPDYTKNVDYTVSFIIHAFLLQLAWIIRSTVYSKEIKSSNMPHIFGLFYNPASISRCRASNSMKIGE
jgi:tellurite resistance protein TehA-like permease